MPSSSLKKGGSRCLKGKKKGNQRGPEKRKRISELRCEREIPLDGHVESLVLPDHWEKDRGAGKVVGFLKISQKKERLSRLQEGWKPRTKKGGLFTERSS